MIQRFKDWYYEPGDGRDLPPHARDAFQQARFQRNEDRQLTLVMSLFAAFLGLFIGTICIARTGVGWGIPVGATAGAAYVIWTARNARRHYTF